MHEKTPLTTMVVCQRTISDYIIQEKYSVEAQFWHPMKFDEIFFGLEYWIEIYIYNYFVFILIY